jgi:hypothetical protein
LQGEEMSFEAVWGFDPDGKGEGHNLSDETGDLGDYGYDTSDELEAQIPLGTWAQLNELRRIFELEKE